MFLFCVACVCNDYHRKNQSRPLKMGVMSHLFNAHDTFSSWFSFSLFLSTMPISLTNLTMKVLGPGSPPVHALFHFSLKIPFIVWIAQNLLVVSVAYFPLVVSVEYFCWLCQLNIKSWSNLRIDSTIRIDSNLRIDSTIRIDSTGILI